MWNRERRSYDGGCDPFVRLSAAVRKGLPLRAERATGGGEPYMARRGTPNACGGALRLPRSRYFLTGARPNPSAYACAAARKVTSPIIRSVLPMRSTTTGTGSPLRGE